jgi:hypothetical protein
MPIGKVVFPSKARRRVAGIHGAIPIGQLIPLTRGTALRIGFTNDDWLIDQLRVRRDDPKAVVDRAQLIRNPHAHMTIDKLGTAFGMKGNKV